jgi:hypothetical protein
MLLRFYGVVFVMGLYACAGSGESGAPGSGARTNNAVDLKNAEKTGKEMYAKLCKGDSITIYNLFQPALKDNFTEYMEMMRARTTQWGELKSWKIISSSSYVSAKDDTVKFDLVVTAFFEDGESYDEFTLMKTGDKDFELVDYDFGQRHMYSCGLDALEELKPMFKKYSEALVFAYKGQMHEMAGSDSVFYDSLVTRSKSTFPEGTTLDSISFESGYMHKKCGTNGGANGIMVYKVYIDTDKYEHLIYKIHKTYGGAYEVYEVVFDGELLIDDTEDVELAQRISKDVWKIIKEKNPEKFFSTFHSELSSLYDDESKKDIKEIVENFAALGNFSNYYDWHTYHTSNNNLIYFIMILEITDSDGNANYLEMVFKPDENHKYMLLSCNELSN